MAAMTDADTLTMRYLMRNAGCDAECKLEMEYQLLERRNEIIHYQRNKEPSPESVVRLYDEEWRRAASLNDEFERRRVMLVAKMKADHDHWANKPISLYDFDEEAERARLQPV